MTEPTRIVFAFSGWPEEARALRHLVEDKGAEVVTLTADLGQGQDLDGVREQALEAGAVRAHVMDLREPLARDYLLPALQACGASEGGVPLARELRLAALVRALADVAGMEGAHHLAHGGSGDDATVHGQFEELVETIHPGAGGFLWPAAHLDDEAGGRGPSHVIVSLLGREQRMDEHDGRTLAGNLYRLTREPAASPDAPALIELDIESGVPAQLNGVRLSFPELLDSLETIVGAHGVGRFDGVLGPYSTAYDRRTRHVGEAPAVLGLATAYDALERRVWPAELFDLKQHLATAARSLIRRGRWFSPARLAIAGFVTEAHRRLTGTVRLELFKGGCRVVA